MTQKTKISERRYFDTTSMICLFEKDNDRKKKN